MLLPGGSGDAAVRWAALSSLHLAPWLSCLPLRGVERTLFVGRRSVSCLSECCHGACFFRNFAPLLGLCFSFAKVRQTDIGKYHDAIAAKKFRHAFLLFRVFTEKIGFSGFFLAIPCLCSPSLCFVFLHRKNYRARKASSFTF